MTTTLLENLERVPGFSRPAAHLRAQAWPAVLYVIGDVHGCHEHLLRLEAKIAADAEEIKGEKWLVLVGDYIDRGPRSAQVLAHLQSPPPEGFGRIALTGNHEVMMLRALRSGAGSNNWIANGGGETLWSYGIVTEKALDLPASRWPRDIAGRIPPQDLDFLETLPLTVSLPGLVVVHAGLRPGVSLANQSETDLLWSRPDHLPEAPSSGPRLVHGHTPLAAPFISPHRINVDTGAFATGRLTAARLTPDGAVGFLHT